mgnify:CR=1 FL=1
MSVGPGKIRVFRADDKGAKKAESPTRRKSVSAKPKKAPRPEPRVLVADGKTPGNRAAANGRTVSPSNPLKLVTPSDASVFLLSNRKELDTYINPDARGRAVDLLTELLLQWSGSPPDSIGIDFDDVSLTPDQKV